MPDCRQYENSVTYGDLSFNRLKITGERQVYGMWGALYFDTIQNITINDSMIHTFSYRIDFSKYIMRINPPSGFCATDSQGERRIMITNSHFDGTYPSYLTYDQLTWLVSLIVY